MAEKRTEKIGGLFNRYVNLIGGNRSHGPTWMQRNLGNVVLSWSMVSLWKLRGTHVLVDSMLLSLLHLTHLHLPEYRHWRQRWSSSGLSLKWSWRSHIKLSGVLEPASPGILCRSRGIFQNRPSEASWTPLSPVIVSMGPGSSTLCVSPVQCFMYPDFPYKNFSWR